MNSSRLTVLGRASHNLASSLRRRIHSGELSAGEYLPSIRTLCAEHKVAADTVCRALRRLERERLIVSHARQGYRVVSEASGIGERAPLACVLGADESPGHPDPLVQKLVGMCQEQAAGLGTSLLVVGTKARAAEDVVAQLCEARVWGALLVRSDLRLLATMARASVPAVMLEAATPDTPLDTITQDGFSGAMLAAGHLAQLGHERIGWLGPETAGTAIQIAERLGGAVAGLAHAGRTLLPELRAEVPYGDFPRAVDAARRLLSMQERPTAVLALWLDMSEAVARAGEELGLVPGRDFDMVGWCTEEAYVSGFRPLFKAGPVAPAVVWSVANLAEAAVARLADRRAHPEWPPLRLRIPARLRMAE